MRKAYLAGVLAVGVWATGAAAAGPADSVFEPAVYFKLGFGGAARAPDARLGLRLAYDPAYLQERVFHHHLSMAGWHSGELAAQPLAMASLLGFELASDGSAQATMSGMNLLRYSGPLQQNGASAGEEGAKSGWSWGQNWGTTLLAGGAAVGIIVLAGGHAASENSPFSDAAKSGSNSNNGSQGGGTTVGSGGPTTVCAGNTCQTVPPLPAVCDPTGTVTGACINGHH